jgi:hypothetical protein
VSDYCLTPNEQLFSYIMARTSYIQCNDGDARFVLDQHAEFDFYSARSLKQQSVAMCVFERTFIRHVQNRKIGMPNNFKIFGTMKTKGPNQDTKVSFEWEISFGSQPVFGLTP